MYDQHVERNSKILFKIEQIDTCLYDTWQWLRSMEIEHKSDWENRACLGASILLVVRQWICLKIPPSIRAGGCPRQEFSELNVLEKVQIPGTVYYRYKK